MNKAKALERLNALESEAKELRKIIEAPAPAPPLLTKPMPESGAHYWTVVEGKYCQLSDAQKIALSADEYYYTHGNIFQSEELASAYAEAIDTMLLLRHQPGTESPASARFQWVIHPEDDLMTSLEVDDPAWLAVKSRFISPCFATKADAERAINTVGKERILRMFKTLHHVI